MLIKFFFKIPIVIHYRSTIPYNSFAHKIISTLIVKYIAEFVIFISKTEKKKFFKIYPSLKLCRFETIYNISENKLSNSKKNYLSKNLVYVGNISFFKGVDRLLDVAKHLT